MSLTSLKEAPRARPITIAHRGASAYLPEHSLAAKAMAHAMGADFLEQDLVATADDRLVVLHDIHIDRVTDVGVRFPDRQRNDGRFYARDFTLAELQSLALTERLDADGVAVFPARFPAGPSALRIPSLEDELQLIQGMNRATGRTAGIYPELKKPAWHREEGVDIAAILLKVLAEFNYPQHREQVWVQCFDLNENIRLRSVLKCNYNQVQLIGDDSWGESDTRYEALLAPGGLQSLNGIVEGIGPWIAQLYQIGGDDQPPLPTSLIEEARAMRLAIHPYTLRADALPAGFSSFDSALKWLTQHGISGIFTDFPDRAVSWFDSNGFAPANWGSTHTEQ
ncbi:MAG: glycerophosphodiester phosphodiesterase [Pseudomonadota bacterium]